MDVREQLGFPNTKQDQARRKTLRARAAILDSNHAAMVQERIALLYENPEMVRRIQSWVNRGVNTARDIVYTLAVAYVTQPRRYMPTKAPERLKKALRDILEEAGVARYGAQLNRYSLFTGPSLVIPSVRGSGDEAVVELSVHQGGWLDFDWKKEDPLLAPSRALVETEDGYLELDESGQRVYTLKGKEVSSTRVDVGRLPAALFPGSDPTEFWQEDEHIGLVDATIHAGVLYAQMQYTRKSQSRKQLALENPDREGVEQDSPPGQQFGDLEGVVELAGGQRLTMHDLTVDPQQFIDSLNDLEKRQQRQYGIPTDTLLGQGNLLDSLNAGKLRGLRSEQTEVLDYGEHDLMDAIWAVVQVSDHRYAQLLREYEDQWRGRIQIEFTEITMAESPVQAEELYLMKAKRGGTNPAEQYQQDNPQYTIEESEQKVLENFQMQARLNAVLVAGNAARPGEDPRAAPGDAANDPQAGGFQTGAQINGRAGGEVSGAVRRGEDPE